MTSIRPVTRPWRLAGLLVALLTLAATTAQASATVRTSRGRLSGDTTIQWRGVAGIRLDTARGGRLRYQDITVDLRGGTYADVHLVPMPQPPACVSQHGFLYCVTGSIRHFRALAPYEPDQRPGHRNEYLIWDPADLFGHRLDVYLFTDGIATLRIRNTGYGGRTTYVANGRVRGELRALPLGCAVAGACASGAANGGGVSFETGRHAFASVLAYDIQPESRVNQPRLVRPCLYPNEFDPDASPRAEDHPLGCDPVDVGSPEYSVSGYSFGTSTGFGASVSYHERGVSGRRYAGYVAGTAPQPSERGGWVVWFDYGIT